MARPTSLTPELQERVCKYLRDGNYLQTAAQACGVCRETLSEWKRRGLTGEEPYASFAHAVACAQAEAEADMVAGLRDAALDPNGFKRAAKHFEWLLERTRRDRFGPSVKIEIEEAKTKLLDVVARVCSPEDFARVLEALERDGSEVPGEARDPQAEHVH